MRQKGLVDFNRSGASRGITQAEMPRCISHPDLTYVLPNYTHRPDGNIRSRASVKPRTLIMTGLS